MGERSGAIADRPPRFRGACSGPTANELGMTNNGKPAGRWSALRKDDKVKDEMNRSVESSTGKDSSTGRFFNSWLMSATALALTLYLGSAPAGASNPPGLPRQLSGLQPALHGAWQEEQVQPPIPHLQQPVEAPAAPGANVLLSMGNNEPTIAVDANNPLHLAVATYLGIRVSTDGGVTFQPRVNVAAPTGFDTNRGGDSSLGYDSQGRLFWTFLLQNSSLGGFDVFVAQCNPNTGAILAGYPVNVTVSARVPNDNSTHSHDKSWLAVDSSADSPFRDRLYVVWTDFVPNASVIRTTFSTDQGATWSAALALSGGGEGFVWPSQNTVAPNGDVYAAYHSQTGFTWNNPDGTSGKIYVLRSTDGGANYPQKDLAYGAGQADLTFNVQAGPRTIPGTKFWLQGSVQPRILADPKTAGRIYVIANQQPGTTDFADVYIVTSTDNGGTWSAPAPISGGAAGTIQVMPSAGIDPVSGCITVTYYDNRSGKVNAGGDFLLDLFSTTSGDGGATFSPDVQINTAAFDPDLNAGCRFDCGTPANTLRIGEYNGVAVGGGVAFAVWTGNNGSGFQDTFFNQYSACVTCTLTCPANIVQANDPGLCGATVNYPAPTTSGGCGPVNTTPASGSFFPVGTTTVTGTSAAGSSCTFTVTVNDTEPPNVNSSVATASLWPPNHDLVNVGLAVTATDNCPGTIALAVAVFSNESEDAAGDCYFSPDAKDLAPGTLRLRSERLGNGGGRVYLIVTTATDTSGNQAHSCATVVVPQDRSAASIASVNSQAAAASAFCAAHDGAVPAGFLKIGIGPVSGPKQ
jgi:hypothetical protein